MSQADFNVDGTQTRTNWVIEANACWQALATNNSGSTAPNTTYPFMWWADTATNTIKQRNAANSAWILIGPLFTKSVSPETNNFRLSVTSGNPFGTGTGATILYFTPVNGNRLALYDSTNSLWREYELSEQSITLSCTSGNVYDIFAYDDGTGAVVFEQLVWTNVNTRATALVRQDGVWVRSGSTNKRYIGSYYATGTNTTEQSPQRALVFNASNRHFYNLFYKDVTGNYTWVTGNTVRQMRNSTTSRFDVLIGLPGTPVSVQTSALVGIANNSQFYYLTWGVDSTTAISNLATEQGAYLVNVFSNCNPILCTSALAVGFRQLNALEYSSGGSGNLVVASGFAFTGTIFN